MKLIKVRQVNQVTEESSFSGSYNDLIDKPTIPTSISDLTGTMDDIENGTTYVKTENNFTDALASKLSGIEAGAEVNVQPDWNQATDTADDYIKNKPTSFGLTQPQILARNLGC